MDLKYDSNGLIPAVAQDVVSEVEQRRVGLQRQRRRAGGLLQQFDVVPMVALHAVAREGQHGLAQKLLGNLEIDISSLLELGWQPPAGPAFDLERMVRSQAASRKAKRPDP